MSVYLVRREASDELEGVELDAQKGEGCARPFDLYRSQGDLQAGGRGLDGFEVLGTLYGVWGTGCEEVI